MFGMGGNQTYRQALNGVESWTPSKAYRSETKFQNDLQSYLDEFLNDSGGGVGMGVGGGMRYEVGREKGSSRADVEVKAGDYRVAIELKRDLSNSQVDRLDGQINKMSKEYPAVIVCACGIKDMDGWRRLQNDWEGMPALGNQRGQVTFVHKEKQYFGTDRGGKSGGGLFGGGGGLF